LRLIDSLFFPRSVLKAHSCRMQPRLVVCQVVCGVLLPACSRGMQLRRIFLGLPMVVSRVVLVARSLRMQLRLIAAECGIHPWGEMFVARSARMQLRLLAGPCRQASAGVHATRGVLGRSMHACRFFPYANVRMTLYVCVCVRV
jgi:hypothetical protein